MALDQDYVLGVAVQLQTESIAAFEAQVRAQLESIKPVQIQAVQMAPEQNAQLQKMLAEQQAILDANVQKQKAANEQTLSNWEQRTVSTGQQLDAETKIIQEKLAQQQAIIEASAAKQQASLALTNQGFNESVVTGADGSVLERQQRVLEKYVPALNSATQAQKGFAEQMLVTSDSTGHFLKSMGNIATWSAAIALLYGAGNTVFKGFQDAIHSQQEQVIQGFYYGAQGKNFTPQMSQQTMADAIVLARKYGDEVIKTQEAIGLWAKVTGGDLPASLAMADNALKLNSVTGMNNEEIYRSSVGVLSQYHMALSRTNDLFNVGVGLAFRYAGGIKMVGGESQDAARQMIEGMDKSAAVMSSFGLSMEQSAAMVVTLLHAGNFQSGAQAGQKISQAFDTFRKGASEQALKEMGISTYNNPHFMEQLQADWNKKVGGKSTLGAILEAHVSPFAIEALSTLMGQVNLYNKAYKEAYEYEKSHPLEMAYQKLRLTTAFQFNQLKAGFEGVSITLARGFIPEMQSGMQVLEQFVTWLLVNAHGIDSFIRGFAQIGIVVGAIEVLKLLGSVVLKLGSQWTNLAALSAGSAAQINASANLAAMGMTKQDEAAIAALNSNGMATSEMTQQWKVLAASVGKSVAEIIAEVNQLRIDTAEGASSVVLSEESIGSAMAGVASQVGVESTVVEGYFNGMRTSAESAAIGIREAFAAVIPVIGQVIVFGMIANQIRNWAVSASEHNKLAADKYASQQGNDTLAQQDIASTRAKLVSLDKEIAFHKAFIRQHTPGVSGSINAGNPYLDNPAQIELQAAAITAEEKHKQHILAYLAAVKAHSTHLNPLTSPTAASVQNQIDRAQADALKKMYAVPGGMQDSGGVYTPPNKAAQAAAAQAVNASGDAVKRQADAVRSKIAADEKEIETSRLLIEYTNNHTQAIKSLGDAYAKTMSDMRAALSTDHKAKNQYEYLASISKSIPQRDKYLNEANAMSGTINNLKAQLDELQAKEQSDLYKFGASQMEQHFGGLMGGIKTSMRGLSSDTIPQLDNLHKQINGLLHTVDQLAERFKGTGLGGKFSAWAQALSGDLTAVNNKASNLKTKLDEISHTISGKSSDFQQGISGNNLAMSSGEPWDKQFASSMDSITSKFNSFEQEWEKWAKTPGVDQSQLAGIQSLAQAWEQSSIALAQYNRALAEAKASPAYAAVTALGNDIGSTLTGNVMSMFTQGDQNQITAIESQIAQLEYEKNMLTGQNNLVERNLLEQKIKRLEADKNGIDQRMRHPNFLKQVQEDMVKAIMKGLTDQFTKTLQHAFLDTILPKQQTIQEKANLAIDGNTKIVTTLNSTLTETNNRLGSLANAQVSGSGGGSASNSIYIPGMGNIPLSSGGFGGASASGSSIGSMIAGGALGLGTALPAGSFNFAGPGGSVPSFLSPSASSGSGGALSSIAGPAAGFGFMSAMQPYEANQATSGGSTSGGASSSGGFWSSGKGNVQHIMGALGGISMAVGGYDQGGLSGSLMSGYGLYEALLSAGVGGPIAIPLAAAGFLLSLFHPHYNPSKNPDMYADSGFAQGVADAQGQAYTQATGWVQEDPGLKQQLGGLSQLQYLDAWYNQYPGGNGLNQQGKQLWDEIGHVTGNGKGVGVSGLHQGNVFVSDNNGKTQVGESGNWQTVLQDIDSATNQLYALENENTSGKGTWISVNSYGAGGGASSSFSPWNTPGLSSSDVSAVMSMPYPALGSNASVGTTIDPGSGSPSGGAGGAGYGGGGAGGGYSPMSVTSNIYLNSDLIARQVSAYRIQRETSGFAANY